MDAAKSSILQTLRERHEILDSYTDDQIWDAFTQYEQSRSTDMTEFFKLLPTLKVEFMYLVITKDEAGNEAICVMEFDGGTSILMASSERRAELLHDFAQRIAKDKGTLVQLIKLTQRDVVAEFWPT